MGLRHRSIRLRVGILIVVPVLCLIALYGFAASITLGSALTQAHAKTVRNDLLTPVGNFQAALAAERHLAVLSLADPTSTHFASEVGMQENNTRKALDALQLAVTSAPVADNASVGEQRAIQNLMAEAHTLTAVRSNVAAGATSMSAALADYNRIINAGYTVLDEAIDSQSNVPVVTQALDVINLDRGLQAALAESDLLTGDMTQLKFPAERQDRLRRAGRTAAAAGRHRDGRAPAGLRGSDQPQRHAGHQQVADRARRQGHILAVAQGPAARRPRREHRSIRSLRQVHGDGADRGRHEAAGPDDAPGQRRLHRAHPRGRVSACSAPSPRSRSR